MNVVQTTCSREQLSPGLQLLTLTLGQRTPLEQLAFCNYYTESLAVLAQYEGDAELSVLLPFVRLMVSPHCEDGAQTQYLISLPKDSRTVTKLQLVLRQPSSQWMQFDLKSIVISRPAPDQRNESTRESQRELELHPIEVLASKVDPLATQLAAETARSHFEVEGNYELEVLVP
eukprot:m.879197 g.879197  ORF g.879197 m.879197 type:complete len:174 (+) comp59842_c0_seq2:4702-5223(+)